VRCGQLFDYGSSTWLGASGVTVRGAIHGLSVLPMSLSMGLAGKMREAWRFKRGVLRPGGVT
jgi:hypothetical protein